MISSVELASQMKYSCLSHNVLDLGALHTIMMPLSLFSAVISITLHCALQVLVIYCLFHAYCLSSLFVPSTCMDCMHAVHDECIHSSCSLKGSIFGVKRDKYGNLFGEVRDNGGESMENLYHIHCLWKSV